MQAPIQHKRSSEAAKVPATGDLVLGELAINTFDGKLYLKKNDGTEAIVTLSVDGHGHAIGDIDTLQETLDGLADASGIAVDGEKVGYRNVPAATAPVSTGYTLAAADVGKHVEIAAGGSITVPNNVFSAGDAVSLFNNTASDATITLAFITAYLAGEDGNKSSLTLAARGLATIFFASATICVVSGNVS